jgi:hypothetical protein
MSKPSPDGRPVDLETVRADEALLESLRCGDAVPADDELATLLGAWRADLDTEPLPAFDLYAPVSPTASAATVVPAPPVVTDAGPGTGGVGAAPGGLYASARGRRRPALRPRTVRLAVAAALVVAAAGGVSVAAAGARPDSPLWPVTKIVNPGSANVRAAQDAVAKARAALDAGHYDDARRLVDAAEPLISKVQDPRQAATLRDQLDAVRRALPAATVPGGGTGTAASPTPTPTAPGPSAPAATGGATTPSGPPVVGSPVPQSPAPSGSHGGLLPPLPLPSLLPSLLPHL